VPPRSGAIWKRLKGLWTSRQMSANAFAAFESELANRLTTIAFAWLSLPRQTAIWPDTRSSKQIICLPM